jgi:ribosomal protein S18
MSKQKEETKPIDYEKEVSILLDFISDVGLQLQVFAKNTRNRIDQQKRV